MSWFILDFLAKLLKKREIIEDIEHEELEVKRIASSSD